MIIITYYILLRQLIIFLSGRRIFYIMTADRSSEQQVIPEFILFICLAESGEKCTFGKQWRVHQPVRGQEAALSWPHAPRDHWSVSVSVRREEGGQDGHNVTMVTADRNWSRSSDCRTGSNSSTQFSGGPINNYPANTKHLYNICTMLDQRRRRWYDVVHMLYKCFVVAG